MTSGCLSQGRHALILMSTFAKVRMMGSAFIVASLSPLSQTTPPKPAFAVVSVRPSPPDNIPRPFGPRGDTFTMSGSTLRMLLEAAFRNPNGGLLQPPLQIVGGPNWIDRERFDVQAKADCNSGRIAQDQIPLMLQSMLEERFGLKHHFETRQLPVYALVGGKNGPRIKASQDQSVPLPLGAPPEPCTTITEPAAGERGLLFPTLPDAHGPTPRGAIMTALNPQREM